MEIINKSDEKLLAEYEQFASTSKYGNFMQSLKWPKVKDNWGWVLSLFRKPISSFSLFPRVIDGCLPFILYIIYYIQDYFLYYIDRKSVV